MPRVLVSAGLSAALWIFANAQPVAALTCSPRTPGAITASAPDSQKCQETIAKAGAKFIKAKVKVLNKCKLKEEAGHCPTAGDQEKIDKARGKAIDKIAAECAGNTVQAGLSSSYGDLSDEGVISSCLLSQYNVTAELISATTSGATAEAWPNSGDERAACVKELSKTGGKFADKALKIVNNCLKKQAKLDTPPADMAPVCLGSFDGGGIFVPPSDDKTDEKLAKLLTKTNDKLTDKCGAAAAITDALGLSDIASIFACPGSQTVADLQTCIACTGLNAAFDSAEQAWAEDGVYVQNAPGALQLAVGATTAAATTVAGTKFLIEPGDYEEEVTIHEGGDGIALVGCGGASNDRPRVIPPAPQTTGRGIQANNVDGLLFQSLDFFDQDNDHIRVSNAEGVTFRDITGDGNRNTAYAVFPIMSNDVLVELCKVRAQDDAPIYVGQSGQQGSIVVRYNDVREGVAGIEIENCGNAQVYGNYGADNTAGLLVFKDGDLIELSSCHEVHHNLFENNNEPNFGSGSVGQVPTGTGILVISTDASPYIYNIARGNNSVGLVAVDQETASFDISPIDASIDDNYFVNNWVPGNGDSPDLIRWPLGPNQDFVFLAPNSPPTIRSTGNCYFGNILKFDPNDISEPDGSFFNAFFNDAYNDDVCVTAPPAVFPGCPVTFP